MSSKSEDVTRQKNTSHSIKVTNLRLLFDALIRRSSHRSVKFYIHKECKGVYFQDQFMKTFYDQFPEFVSLHFAAKIIELQLILYVLISEDSNGHCEIVGAYLLFNDDEESISWLLNCLKTCLSQKTQTLLLDYRLDKKLSTDIFLNSVFEVSQSRYHSLKCVEEHLYEQGIPLPEIASTLKIFETVLSATSETVYEDACSKLSPELTSHFENERRDIWTLSLKFRSKSFLRPLDEFLRVISKKFKVIHPLKSLEQMMNVFFNIVLEHRKSHFLKVSDVVQTLDYNGLTIEQRAYLQILTNYATKLIIRQMQMMSTAGVFKLMNNGFYRVLGFRSETTTIENCSCKFKKIVSLPCCHILSLRSALGLNLFHISLCSIRWFRDHYRRFFVSLHSPYLQIYEPESHVEVPYNFQKFVEVLNNLSPLLTDSSDPQQMDRMDFIDLLRESWSVGFNVETQVVNSGAAQSSQSFNESLQMQESTCGLFNEA